MVIYKTKSDHQKKANISFLWDLGSLLGAMLFNSNSTIWYNIQIWWVLNTAGFSRRDVPWLIFFILEPGIPDGLLIEVEFKQDAGLRKNKQGEVSRGFFDFWPEIPAIAQPSEPIEGNTIHRASYANEALVLKNPEKGKKHVEFCKAFQYPEAYYKFGLSFKNSITGEELVFPETFTRLHVFNTNV